MDYRIEQMDCNLRFAVKRETVKTADAFATVPQLWANAMENYLAPGAEVEQELWVPVIAR